MSSLRQTTATGLRWGAVAGGLVALLQLLQMVLLGRLLGPNAFGLMAMVLIVSGFVTVIRDAGVPEYVVHKQQLDGDALSTLAWVNLGIGLALAGITIATAPLIAAGFDAPALVAPLKAVSALFVVSAFGVVSRALLQVRLAFKAIALADVAGVMVNMLTSLVMALTIHPDVWALVIGLLAGAAVRTVLLGRAARGEGLMPGAFHWPVVTGFARFGSYQIGATTLGYFRSRIDQFLIGILFGVNALGIYNMAVNLVLQPSQQINQVLSGVAFPVLSRIQRQPDRLRSGFLRLLKASATLNAPALLGLAAISPVAVPLVLGERWQPMVPVLMALSVYALLRAVVNVSGSLMMARGKARWGFNWNLAMLPVGPVVIVLAAQSHRIQVVALALAVLQIALAVGHYRMITRRLLGPIGGAYLGAIVTPIGCATGMAVAVLALGETVLNGNILGGSGPLAAGVQLALGVTVYIGLMALFDRATLADAIRMIRRR